MGSHCLMVADSVCGDKNVLEIDSVDNCKTF